MARLRDRPAVGLPRQRRAIRQVQRPGFPFRPQSAIGGKRCGAIRRTSRVGGTETLRRLYYARSGSGFIVWREICSSGSSLFLLSLTTMGILWLCVRINSEHFSNQHGLLRPYSEQMINRYLDCGVLYSKFARYKMLLITGNPHHKAELKIVDS